jgi:hypothetical protein
MPKNATAADAQVILQLYDLRRETEMRKARSWWFVSFWPQTADDFMKVMNAVGTPENAWLRQVAGYWDMAAALAVQGAVNQELFLVPSFSGEMFTVFAKVRPFLGDLRKKLNNPELMGNIEILINSSKKARERLKQFETRLAARRKLMMEAASAKARAS